MTPTTLRGPTLTVKGVEREISKVRKEVNKLDIPKLRLYEIKEAVRQRLSDIPPRDGIPDPAWLIEERLELTSLQLRIQTVLTGS